MNEMFNITDDPHHININDYVTAKNMAEALHKFFPGHKWAVTCQGDQGIATIRNISCSGEYGYVLRLRRLYGDPHMLCVLRAGGEILERFGLPAGRAIEDRIAEMALAPNGAPVFDPGSAKSKVATLLKDAWNKLRGVWKPNPLDVIAKARVDNLKGLWAKR